MKLLILKTGSTVAPVLPRRGDFEAWFRRGLGLGDAGAPVLDAQREPLPDPAAVPAVVVTGSPAMVTDEAPWSVRCEAFLRELVRRGTPVLGVCYGHQLLGKALGGRVADNPRGREVGTIAVSLTEAGRRSPLFAGLPPTLTVQTSHCQSVLEPPPGAVALAANAHDACQAFAAGERAFGVQFHPEFDADIVRGYLDARREAIAREGLDAAALAAGVRDSAHGTRILANFLELL